MTKGWKIATIAVVVGVVTYVGLEVLLPHHKVEVKMTGLVPADSVFSGTLKSPEAVAAADQTTPGSEAADAAATTPSGPAVAADDAMAPSGDDSGSDQAATDTTPPADESAAAGDTTGMTDGSAPASSDDAGSEPAAPAPAAPAPAPVKPVAKPASKPAPAQPAPKKTPTVSASKATSWWESSGNAQGLHVIYAGSAAFERAVVVMGNAPFASAVSANQNIRVSDAAGKAVAGSWKVGANNRSMLVFPVSKPGKFQVAVGAGLSDAQNRKLGQSVKGTVVIQ